MREIQMDNFIEEVKKVREKYNIEIEDFRNIYQVYTGEELNIDIIAVCDNIIKTMFGTYGEPMLPYNFVLSDLGKVIISVRYGINNRIYSMSELSELTGLPKQNISYDISIGKLKVDKKKGFSILHENDINEYLKKKELGTLAELKANLRKITYKEQEEIFVNGGFEREEEYGK